MTNVEAYNILGDMWYEATSKEKEAINIAKGVKYIYCDMSASGVADETHDFVHEWYGDVTICPLCGRRLEEV